MTNPNNESSVAELDLTLTSKPSLTKIEQLLSFLPFGFKKPKPVVAVVRLCGIIGKVSSFKSGLSIETLNENLEKAFKLPKLKAVCLSINSPGGSPVQSELIANRIRLLAKEKKIEVYSFVEDIAASGGYWLACAGDKIFASKSSIIGSIGVISSGFGFQEAINKLGIERRIYTEGKNKSILDPFLPERASDVKILKKIQKQLHENFINYIKERRIGKLTQNDDILFNGEFWAGQTALDFGLIDGIEDMYHFIKNKYGKDVKIEYIGNKQPWIKRKLGMVSQNFSQGFADAIVNRMVEEVTYNKFKLF